MSKQTGFSGFVRRILKRGNDESERSDRLNHKVPHQPSSPTKSIHKASPDQPHTPEKLVKGTERHPTDSIPPLGPETKLEKPRSGSRPTSIAPSIAPSMAPSTAPSVVLSTAPSTAPSFAHSAESVDFPTNIKISHSLRPAADAASVFTIASSSRRRRSLDTNASTRAIAESVFSAESEH